jgi:radical SAM/Cys-rich protein
MRDTRQLLDAHPFPAIRRKRIETLQVNLGYRCNQSCTHCHVAAGPHRTEQMDDATVDAVIAFMRTRRVSHLDLTGGAPELHPRFRDLVRHARALGIDVIDRCNLTILSEPGQEDLAGFFAAERVTVTASLPCYLQDNVDRQRGKGVYERSIAGLKQLNTFGYGIERTGLTLNLVYNPNGAVLPPPQAVLEADYRRELHMRHGVVFSQLFTLANMPIQRFGATLLAHDALGDYLDLLRHNHSDANLDGVMCRTMVSVDYRGIVYDCDFNQMLDLPVERGGAPVHLSALIAGEAVRAAIRVGGHCYGCTAGQGSSCGGALAQAAE